MTLTRKQQINILAAAALGVAILVMLIIAFANRGTGVAYEQYDDARQRFLAHDSGTVQMHIFAESLTGLSSFYEGEASYFARRGAITSYALTTAQRGDRRYSDSTFFDGEQFYHSLGGGWFVHPASYYGDYLDTDPFYDIGPALDRNYVADASKVDNSDTVVYTFTMAEDTPPVPYLLHFFEDATFRERSAVVTLRAGQLDEIRRVGTLAFSEGAAAESFEVEIVYRFFALGEGTDVARPDGV